MKRIKMKTLSASPHGVMEPGKTYPVDDKTAASLVKNGYAEYAEEPVLRQAVKPLEPERAIAKHVGGGWYDYQGKRMRKSDLPDGVIK